MHLPFQDPVVPGAAARAANGQAGILIPRRGGRAGSRIALRFWLVALAIYGVAAQVEVAKAAETSSGKGRQEVKDLSSCLNAVPQNNDDGSKTFPADVEDRCCQACVSWLTETRAKVVRAADDAQRDTLIVLSVAMLAGIFLGAWLSRRMARANNPRARLIGVLVAAGVSGATALVGLYQPEYSAQGIGDQGMMRAGNRDRVNAFADLWEINRQGVAVTSDTKKLLHCEEALSRQLGRSDTQCWIKAKSYLGLRSDIPEYKGTAWVKGPMQRRIDDSKNVLTLVAAKTGTEAPPNTVAEARERSPSYSETIDYHTGPLGMKIPWTLVVMALAVMLSQALVPLWNRLLAGRARA